MPDDTATTTDAPASPVPAAAPSPDTDAGVKPVETAAPADPFSGKVDDAKAEVVAAHAALKEVAERHQAVANDLEKVAAEHQKAIERRDAAVSRMQNVLLEA